MKRRLGTLLASAAIAFAVIATPFVVSAFQDAPQGTITNAGVGFPYFGGLAGGAPLLPCTGFMQIVATTPVGYDANGPIRENGVIKTVSTTYSVVDEDATGGLPQCTSVCDLFTLVNRLLILALSIVVTVILPLMIMIGAGYIITGGGNPGQRAQGMKIIQATLVGIVIFVFGFFIVNQMLQLVFSQAYGDALREQAANQPGTGLTPDQIEDLFAWDSLTCTPNRGGVTITPGSTTPTTNPTSTTGGGINPGTNNPSVSCVSLGGECIDTRQTAVNRARCASAVTTNSCANPQYPSCCTPQPGHSCIAGCAAQGNVWTGIVSGAAGSESCVCRARTQPPVTTATESPDSPFCVNNPQTDPVYRDNETYRYSCVTGWSFNPRCPANKPQGCTFARDARCVNECASGIAAKKWTGIVSFLQNPNSGGVILPVDGACECAR